jgi:hypothetical protein
MKPTLTPSNSTNVVVLSKLVVTCFALAKARTESRPLVLPFAARFSFASPVQCHRIAIPPHFNNALQQARPSLNVGFTSGDGQLSIQNITLFEELTDRRVIECNRDFATTNGACTSSRVRLSLRLCLNFSNPASLPSRGRSASETSTLLLD